MDAEWCKTQDFGQRIAHGTLIFSVAIGMTAGAINPRAMSYGYDRLRFIRPVFIGDTIRVTATIADKRDHPKRAESGDRGRKDRGGQPARSRPCWSASICIWCSAVKPVTK